MRKTLPITVFLPAQSSVLLKSYINPLEACYCTEKVGSFNLHSGLMRGDTEGRCCYVVKRCPSHSYVQYEQKSRLNFKDFRKWHWLIGHVTISVIRVITHEFCDVKAASEIFETFCAVPLALGLTYVWAHTPVRRRWASGCRWTLAASPGAVAASCSPPRRPRSSAAGRSPGPRLRCRRGSPQPIAAAPGSPWRWPVQEGHSWDKPRGEDSH